MLQIAMLIYPDMFDVDLIGPQTFLQRLGDADVFYVWKDRGPIVSDLGVTYAATHDFASCPAKFDVLFVPGGLKGAMPLLRDGAVLDFLADRGARAKYVASVCTGSLLLGAAGLLTGYKATSYWMVRDLLPLFGAELVPERVVIDRNRVTGGGATAGLDFGLTLASLLRGEDHAKMLQLLVEYDPQPPYDAGAPERAPAGMAERIRDKRAGEMAAAREAAHSAAKRLEGGRGRPRSSNGA
jgi:cyclohexyl-isocyanide hydratase